MIRPLFIMGVVRSRATRSSVALPLLEMVLVPVPPKISSTPPLRGFRPALTALWCLGKKGVTPTIVHTIESKLSALEFAALTAEIGIMPGGCEAHS